MVGSGTQGKRVGRRSGSDPRRGGQFRPLTVWERAEAMDDDDGWDGEGEVR